ncbi:hypothetical protein ACC713_37530, partial [Rhizobium johnstonii]
PLARTSSNLDKTFIDFLDSKLPITALEPADNAGLGLARAMAVANILKSNPKLSQATVLPMSSRLDISCLPCGDRIARKYQL